MVEETLKQSLLIFDLSWGGVLGRPIALGYVHRDFTAPGTAVQVEGHPATVTGLPMA